MRSSQTFLPARAGLDPSDAPAAAESAQDGQERRIQGAKGFGAVDGWGDDPRQGEDDPRDGFQDPQSGEHDPRRDEADPWWQELVEDRGEGEAPQRPVLPAACQRDVAAWHDATMLPDDDRLHARSPLAAARPLDRAGLVQRTGAGVISNIAPDCEARSDFEVAGRR